MEFKWMKWQLHNYYFEAITFLKKIRNKKFSEAYLLEELYLRAPSLKEE
jgi:hypothetical protein